jgi:hypothetical protein
LFDRRRILIFKYRSPKLINSQLVYSFVCLGVALREAERLKRFSLPRHRLRGTAALQVRNDLESFDHDLEGAGPPRREISEEAVQKRKMPAEIP